MGNLLSWVWWEKNLPTLRHTTGWPPPPCLTFYLVTSRWGRLKTGTGYVTGPFPHLFTRNIHGKRLPVLALSPYTNIFCEAPLPPPPRGGKFSSFFWLAITAISGDIWVLFMIYFLTGFLHLSIFLQASSSLSMVFPSSSRELHLGKAKARQRFWRGRCTWW